MFRRFQSLALLAAICLLSTCGPMMAPELSVVAAPKTIDGVNQKARITVAALDEDGKPGTGTVRLTATVGTLEEETLILAAGEAQTMLSCNRALDPACTGTSRVSGTWTSKRGTMAMGDVVITITPPVVDAGYDAGQTMDAGFDAGMQIDAGTPYLDAGVMLDAGRYTLFIGAQDSIPLVGQFFGTNMVGGEALQFSTTSGLVRASADAGSATMITVTTNASGGVSAELIDAPGQLPATATVTLSHPPSGRAASVGIDLVSLRQVSHLSTSCGTMLNNCTLIYAQGSGNTTSAQVTFRVVDGLNRPAPNVRVNFSLNGVAPGVVLTPTSVVTNAMGEASTTVRSGNAASVFRVHATVVPGQVEGDSLDIAVRGGTPSNKGVTLLCSTINVPALKNPPIMLAVNCQVRLVDRSNNPVGTGVNVNLLTEAGTVTSTVATQAYMPGGMSEGYGTFVVSFNGGTPPADVAPLPALAPQFPWNRQAEPSRLDGSITRNPRDGVVTVVVSVIGEEHFDDNNGNGIRDANEPFIDQGEPFVDANDNDVFDPGEIFVNDVDSNGMWTPPNGVWDSAANNHLVWADTKVVVSSSSEPSVGTIEGPIPMLCPGGVPKGGSFDLDIYAPDRNLNRVEAGAAMMFTRTGTRGTISLVTTTVQDGYGFEYERVLVDATTPTQACSPSSTRCLYRSSFGTWGRGRLGILRITGTALTDMTPCADEPGLTVTTTVRGTPVSTNPISFGVQ